MVGIERRSSQLFLETSRGRNEGPSRGPERSSTVHVGEKMDLEELGQTQVHQVARNPTAELPRIVPSKKALYSDRLQSEQPSAPSQQQPAVVYNPVQYSQAPQKVQSQFFPSMQPQHNFMNASQSAMAAPNTSNAPPLFIGFLTNDVSMNQIKNLFTT